MNDIVKLAILYQSTIPPSIMGIFKPMKPGGYSDSGADIAFNLSQTSSQKTNLK